MKRVKPIVFSVLLFIALLFTADYLLGHFRFKNKMEVKEIGPSRAIKLREFPPNSHIELSSPVKLNLNPNKEGRQTTAIRTDADGFIFSGDPIASPDFKIVFLGGSTTVCLWLPEEKRFPYIVQQALRNRTSKRINVYNAALDGNDITHSINTLWNKVLALEPDMVVLMHAVNDINLLQKKGTYWREQERPHLIPQNEPDPMHKFLYAQKEWLPNISTFLMHQFRNDDEWNHARSVDAGFDPAQIKQSYASALKSFIGICRAWDIEPVLMTQFNRLVGLDRSKMHDVERMAEKLAKKNITVEQYQAVYTGAIEINRELAKANELMLIDLDSLVPKDQGHIYDKVHLDVKGAECVAQIITDSLVAKLSDF